MKKIISAVMTLLLVLSFSACGAGASGNAGASSDAEQPAVKSALELLETVWNSYADDEKFAAAGGDASEENMTMDGPGKFGVSDSAALDSTLGFPADEADKIDDAASLLHMMNANTFTCGAFHVKDASALDSVVESVRENILNRQWICGFPEKLVIVTVGDYVVSFFGAGEIVDMFGEKLAAAYPTAETVCDEPIA